MIRRLLGAVVTIVAVPTVSFLFWTVQIEDGQWDYFAAEKPSVLSRLVAYLEQTFIEFDLGRSEALGALPVSQIVREGIVVDLQLLFVGLLLGVGGGLAVGMFWSRGRGSLLSVLLLSSPVWITGAAFLYAKPSLQGSQSLWAPTIALAIPIAAAVARMTSASLLDAMGLDAIRTARGKGVAERTIIRRHALPLAATPVVGMVNGAMGMIVLDLALVEAVFNVRGSFRDLRRAALSVDLSMLQGMVLVTTVLVVIGSLAADLTLAWLRRGTSGS
jgi:peptide/nickel transport system permease protein